MWEIGKEVKPDENISEWGNTHARMAWRAEGLQVASV